MKNIIIALVLVLAFTACKNENKKVEEATTEVVKEVMETPLLAIAEFDDKAGEFVGKEVAVKGIVDHVCKHGGKKLLLVTDEADVHVVSEERFDEALVGSEINLKGVVLEEVIDESTCLKMEEDNIKSHSEGKSNDEQFEAKKQHIKEYRDFMKENNTDHISYYSLQYVSHSELE